MCRRFVEVDNSPVLLYNTPMNAELNQRLDDLIQKITQIDRYEVKRDLKKMLECVRAAQTELSREVVECNRFKHTTVRYRELEAKYVEMLDNLEQWLTMALLIDS